MANTTTDTTTNVRHELRPSRMKGTVSVRFDLDRRGRRRILFGGESYRDDVAEIVTVNGKQYKLCAAVVEEAPNVWKADRGYDTLRVPGGHARGTERAVAAVREECQAVAPAYAETNMERFDASVAAGAVIIQKGYQQSADAAELKARMARDQAELVGWIAEGEARISPWHGRRRRMEFGDGGRSRADVVAHVMIGRGIVGYVGVDDWRHQVFVPESHIVRIYDR